ncbi:glycoside hydrolase family 92 protein (plasmid) [Humibacter sp. BT305]|nr:glycoside hydrolase family 92 protein [Humibacter sp. BT305]
MNPPSARPRSRLLSLVAAGAVALVGAVVPTAAHAAPGAEEGSVSPTSLVNTFIGSQNLGNTYPGAAMPFGMVQFSPDTGHSTGYDWGDSAIRGFSLTHLSGVGCGIAGYLPVLPVVGSPAETGVTRYEDYAMGFSHATAENPDAESAAPGYYRVQLTQRIGPAAGATVQAELAATERTAVQRYTFPAGDDGTVLLNAGQTLTGDTPATVEIVDDHTIRTAITVSGFCQATAPFTVFTETSFDRPFTGHGTWTGSQISPDSDSTSDAPRTGAWATFDTSADADVEAVTALSYVSAVGAHANLVAESGSFDEVRASADSAWQQRLGQVRIPESASTAREFYSALYRSFLSPNIGSDVDGSHRDWDGTVYTGSPGDPVYYQNFSLWDTYRTQQQLLALLAPRESADMAMSLVRMGQTGGWAPRWAYGPVETNIMTGDPITPFLVSAWKQGLLTREQGEEAYELLLANADGVPPADLALGANGRAGNPVYIPEGFVPYAPGERGKPGDYDLQHGASATLEYALADAALATMASDLGHAEDAERLAVRGENYHSIFDASSAAFRPRDRSGLFVGDPDISQAPGFHEGTSAQYEWLAPQDVPGLIDLLGAGSSDPRTAVESRLDRFFAYDALKADPATTIRTDWVTSTANEGGYGRYTYNPNNEPDLHAPYMYLWTGSPSKTVDVVRAAMTLFTDSPSGVTGNDDMGTMSAWYVLSTLGIYPIVPGADLWGLTTPAYSQVEIERGDDAGGDLVISAPGVSDENRYTAAVSADGTAIDAGYLSGSDLRSTGTLGFTVASTPTAWATGADAAPGPLNPPTSIPDRFTGALADSLLTIPSGSSAQTSLNLMVQSDGPFSGTISVVDASPGLSVDIGDATISAGSARTPIPASHPITVTASPLAGSDGSVTLRVVSSGGISRDFSLAVITRTPWLQPSYQGTGIGTPGQSGASFDEGGAYYLRSALEDAGFTPSSLHEVGSTGLVFSMPAYGLGARDNLAMDGQTLTLPADLASTTRISLVGAATNVDRSTTGTATVTYAAADGTTSSQDIALRLTDWCLGSTEGGNIPIVQLGQRVESGGGVSNIGCGLFATAPIALSPPQGMSPVSITLPRNTKMHLFAIAAEPSVSTVGLESDTAETTVGGTVTLTASVGGADRDGVVVLTDAGSDAEAGRARVVDGSAVFAVQPDEGTHAYRATFVPADPSLQAAASSSAVEVVVHRQAVPIVSTLMASLDADSITAGESTTLRLAVEPVTEGTVWIEEDSVAATAARSSSFVAETALVQGRADVALSPQTPGAHSYSIRFTPDDPAVLPSSATVTLLVDAGEGDSGTAASAGNGGQSGRVQTLAATGSTGLGSALLVATFCSIAGAVLLLRRRAAGARARRTSSP